VAFDILECYSRQAFQGTLDLDKNIPIGSETVQDNFALVHVYWDIAFLGIMVSLL
jgi:hypothetical protein